MCKFWKFISHAWKLFAAFYFAYQIQWNSFASTYKRRSPYPFASGMYTCKIIFIAFPKVRICGLHNCIGAWPVATFLSSVDAGSLARWLTSDHPVTTSRKAKPGWQTGKGKKNHPSLFQRKCHYPMRRKLPVTKFQCHMSTLSACDSRLLVFHTWHKMTQRELCVFARALRSIRVFPNDDFYHAKWTHQCNPDGEATQEESVLCRARLCNFKCP